MSENLRLSCVLRQLLKDHELTARELARRTDIPQSTIGNFLAGKEPSRLDHVRTLARYFGVSMEYLLYEEEPEPTATLNSILTESVFDGWLRVKIERAIPLKRKPGRQDK